jgi:hypothetical protein
MPEPRKSKIRIPQVQKWYDDAFGGNITNPWLREDIGTDLEAKEDYIFNSILPIFEPSEGLRGKMRTQWATERDAAQGAAPPTPSPVPTMDDILKQAIMDSGNSGAQYNQ